MAGAVQKYYNNTNRPPNPNATPSIDNVYGAAIKTQTGDYDSIMGRYNDLYNSLNDPANRQKVSFNQVAPSTVNYNQSGDTTAALGDLKSLAATGGYSDTDIQNLRARGLSPITSAYANANREIDRSRGLAGGYSANYAAVKSKMAREQSAQLAQQITNVNAEIAQNVAGNKIAAAPSYASAAGAEQDRLFNANRFNADATNQANQFNSSGTYGANKATADYAQANNQSLLDVMRGATSLYGTTPALASTFGNQALANRAQNSENARFNTTTNQNGQRMIIGAGA